MRVCLSISARSRFCGGRRRVFVLYLAMLIGLNAGLTAQATSFDWAGLYFGGHVGYSRGHAGVAAPSPSARAADLPPAVRQAPWAPTAVTGPDATAFSTSFGTLVGGVQAGYNFVLPSRIVCLASKPTCRSRTICQPTMSPGFAPRRIPTSPKRSISSARCVADWVTRSITG
jgi:hypothetical protein